MKHHGKIGGSRGSAIRSRSRRCRSATRRPRDPPSGGQTRLNTLNSIPAAGSADVVVNTDDEALISTTLFAAYTATIGFTSDSIASTIGLSTAVVIDPGETGDDYAIPLYIVDQTLTQEGEDYVFVTAVTQLGVLTGDSGGSGLAMLSFEEAPEPGAVGAAAIALGWLRRRRAA
jgi:MYXO-CTERM domain-containing protein